MDLQYNSVDDDNAYALPKKEKGIIAPIPSAAGDNPAVNLIRNKIDSLYNEEPNAKQELAESKEVGAHRSKHQRFIYQLSTSGKSLAQIQTDWHNYYVNLPDNEKHEVWREFYDTNDKLRQAPQPANVYQEPPSSPIDHTSRPKAVSGGTQSVADIKGKLLGKVRTRTKLKAKHHLQSLAFGLGMGSLVILILLFSFFNERFIAPFITPSRNVSATPIIVDPNNTSAPPGSEVIIPKINVEIPVIYDVSSVEEQDVDAGLERGVVHYATTPSPGELGNVVVVGHSSNNILNKGKYKFAFVLLSRLEINDTFMLTKDGKRYTYRIYDKKIVKPTDVSVLGAADKPATATLITCDPPGTSINRLVVVGEQISPDPVNNGASTAIKSDAKPTTVPGNSPSLWQRFKNWLF